jgi:hypothetical protein
VIDSRALDAATRAALFALYPNQTWDTMPRDMQEKWTELVTAAIEEYQRQTLKGYAERVERKKYPAPSSSPASGTTTRV